MALTEDPYALRTKGLDNLLSNEEFSRILIHFSQRRGFKSNRKGVLPATGDEGKVIGSIHGLEKEIVDSGARTLGEYLFRIGNRGEKIRKRYTARTMFEQEFALLWKRQRELGNMSATQELEKRISNIIFFQRPLKSASTGECVYFRNRKRAPIAHPFFQRFRMLADVNNLKYRDGSGPWMNLSENERTMILGILEKQKSVKFSAIRKKFEWPEGIIFNLESERRTELKGDEISKGLKEAL